MLSGGRILLSIGILSGTRFSVRPKLMVNLVTLSGLDWPDRTVGLGPDWTGLILVWSYPKVKDQTIKQSPFLVRTGLKLL